MTEKPIFLASVIGLPHGSGDVRAVAISSIDEWEFTPGTGLLIHTRSGRYVVTGAAAVKAKDFLLAQSLNIAA